MKDTETLSLGSTLRDSRQKQGLALKEVAERTKIRLTYLQAIENDRFDLFPGEAYLCGFLRIYANLLDLDVGTILEKYRQQVGSAEPETIAAVPAKAVKTPASPASKTARTRVIISLSITAAVAVTILVGWQITVLDGKQPSPVPRQVESSESSPMVSAGDDSKPVPTAAPDAAEPLANAPVDAAAADTTAIVAIVSNIENPAAKSEPLPVVETETPAADEPAFHPVEHPAAAVTSSRELPDVQAGGGVVKVRTLQPVTLGISVDSDAFRQYDLAAQAVLSWRVRQRVEMRFSDPQALKLWLDQQEIDLNGRVELALQTAGQDRPKEE